MKYLTVSIVVYKQSISELEDCLENLVAQIQALISKGELKYSRIYIVQNDYDEGLAKWIVKYVSFRNLVSKIRVVSISGHGNVGFGRGHNLALERGVGDFHLIMNADVKMSDGVLGACLRQLGFDTSISLVAPTGYDESGNCLYLSKSYPSLIALLARMFPVIKGIPVIKRTADRYVMKDRIPSPVPESVQIASGCFMLIRGERLGEVGGFDPKFFLYFEDFDLSLRLGREGRIVQIPQTIVHFGGDASRKGGAHISMFVKSAFYFFRKHGFKVW